MKINFKKYKKIATTIVATWIILFLIDYLSFPQFDEINYFNLILELILSVLALYPLLVIQQYRGLGFYKVLNLGFFLLSTSYFIDAIDQIFIHSILYTVLMEKITLFIAVILIFIGSKKWITDYKELSLTDDLTKLPNRKLLKQIIKKEIIVCNKNNHIFCLAIIDIDFFKSINDKYGHNIGDSVLTLFARYLSEIKQDDDIVGRWGGEEFILMLKGINKSESIIKLNQMRLKISQHIFTVNKEKIKLTASFGVSQYQYPEYDYEKLFINADKVLYQAKNAGRNQVR
ncbi:MAG: GGDEF domain-containing protein [Alcanivoracaceae bacterium]|nr:GGDEF domain-containing protein [Alcanivoracaceae bacterium]